MPYIKEEARYGLENGYTIPSTAGELNYSLTKLITDYLQQWGLDYQHINDVIGALEGAKMELYRRVAVPYENQKITDNGDVYPTELTQGGQK